MRRVVYLLLVLMCFGCVGRSSQQTTSDADSITREHPQNPLKPAIFNPTLPPQEMSRDEQLCFMRDHYWDSFDFSDSTLVHRLDTTAIMENFAAYVAYILAPDDREGMRNLMRRADVSKPMVQYFQMLGERILNDPNSPVRNSELYIEVLSEVIQSPYLDEFEKLAPQYDLELSLRNRVGQLAEDFTYTLVSGKRFRLHKLSADYTILFINNPGCPMCRDVKDALNSSPMISAGIERGDIKVLMLYPDEDLTEWKSRLSEIPASWINSYDDGCVLTRDRLYDLRAIPSLYLLDRDKRVLLKDIVDVELIEQRIDEE